MYSRFIGKVKLNTKNVEAYKVTMDDVITPCIYSEFYNLLNCVYTYPKVFLKPGASCSEICLGLARDNPNQDNPYL